MNKFVLVNRVTSLNGSLWPPNWELEPRPLYRNVPEGAEVSIDTLPGGEDPFIVQAGDMLPTTFVDDYGNTQTYSSNSIEAELA